MKKKTKTTGHQKWASKIKSKYRWNGAFVSRGKNKVRVPNYKMAGKNE